MTPDAVRAATRFPDRSAPLSVDPALSQTVLAMGTDMKSVAALGQGNAVWFAAPPGDLGTLEGVECLEREARNLVERAGHGPDVIAVDLHPDMYSSRLGRRLAQEWRVPVTAVQHHHAHAAACLAEHGRQEGLVLAMDGTGWGGDGTIWGGELLRVQRGGGFERLASFVPVPLPGGDAAVRRPARQVIGRWVEAGIRWTEQDLQRLVVAPDEAEVWSQQCQRRVNAPLTHAAGRLFDTFSAVLGVAPREIAYEAEPAIRLEEVAATWEGRALPEVPFAVIERDGLRLIDWAPAFRYLAAIRIEEGDRPRWAMAVHAAVARATANMLRYFIRKSNERWVGVSGGVFLNRILNERLDHELASMGIQLLRHRETPPGDGCIALGQCVAAAVKSEI